jgi:phosphotriesterase-related protein
MVSLAVDKLTELRDSGVRTICDPTVDGLGRDIRRIKRISDQVPGLNIVAATGVYTYSDVPFFFAHRGPGVDPELPDPMTDLFVRDITEGIQGTDVKAAFLKCAIDHHGLTKGVERVLRAVAKAHKQTGVPVMVHTHPGRKTGPEAARVLKDEGVEPTYVQLAHSGDTTDADHLAALADQGFLLGMDRFGLYLDMPFEDRVAVVAEMCARGYAGSMVLSQDTSCHIDWIDPDLKPLLPDWDYLHVRREVVPELQKRGVTDEQVTQMLTDNPRRWLTTHHKTETRSTQ